MLYLVTDRNLCKGRSLTDVVRQAAQGGVSMVQLREKDISSREFVELGRAMVELLDEFSIPLIINDRADIAMIIGAAGLHIGQSDILYRDARELMGPSATIGLSIENCAQAIECQSWDVDYIGASPIFSTSTKTDTAPALGLEGLADLRRLVNCPIVAIGGINRTNISAVFDAGADSIAVVSAICSADDPRMATQELLELCTIK